MRDDIQYQSSLKRSDWVLIGSRDQIDLAESGTECRHLTPSLTCPSPPQSLHCGPSWEPESPVHRRRRRRELQSALCGRLSSKDNECSGDPKPKGHRDAAKPSRMFSSLWPTYMLMSSGPLTLKQKKHLGCWNLCSRITDGSLWRLWWTWGRSRNTLWPRLWPAGSFLSQVVRTAGPRSGSGPETKALDAVVEAEPCPRSPSSQAAGLRYPPSARSGSLGTETIRQPVLRNSYLVLSSCITFGAPTDLDWASCSTSRAKVKSWFWTVTPLEHRSSCCREALDTQKLCGHSSFLILHPGNIWNERLVYQV